MPYLIVAKNELDRVLDWTEVETLVEAKDWEKRFRARFPEAKVTVEEVLRSKSSKTVSKSPQLTESEFRELWEAELMAMDLKPAEFEDLWKEAWAMARMKRLEDQFTILREYVDKALARVKPPPVKPPPVPPHELVYKYVRGEITYEEYVRRMKEIGYL